MVTFANLGSVRQPSLKFVGRRVWKIRRIKCVSCLSTTVSQLFEPQLKKNRRFYVFPPSLFVCPRVASVAITQNVAWMKRQFSACQTRRSMYSSIFNTFPVIRTASAKNRHFHVPQPTFLFTLETPRWQLRNMLHGWKGKSMLDKRLTACTHLSSTVSQ